MGGWLMSTPMAITRRNKAGMTDIHASITTKIVFPSPFLRQYLEREVWRGE
jgi:hypothetical protein